MKLLIKLQIVRKLDSRILHCFTVNNESNRFEREFSGAKKYNVAAEIYNRRLEIIRKIEKCTTTNS